MIIKEGDVGTHEHCLHPYQGPLMIVLSDGEMVLKCCKCPAMQTKHGGHVGKAY